MLRAGLAIVVALAGCAEGPRPLAPSQVDESRPGRASVTMQDMPPVERFDAHLCGFHFVSGDLGQQREAHHFLQRVDDDFLQAVLYDGDGASAKLVGVEYVIGERLFRTLPPEEQRLWHSHAFEVASGALIAPGLAPAAEHELMRELAPTYGKAWSLWQSGDALPLGPPRLLMGFTATGQLDPRRLADRDRRFGTSADVLRHERGDIQAPAPAGEADAWERGEVLQVEVRAASDGATRGARQ
jgi:hypothetical protein